MGVRRSHEALMTLKSLLRVINLSDNSAPHWHRARRGEITWSVARGEWTNGQSWDSHGLMSSWWSWKGAMKSIFKDLRGKSVALRKQLSTCMCNVDTQVWLNSTHSSLLSLTMFVCQMGTYIISAGRQESAQKTLERLISWNLPTLNKHKPTPSC